MSTTKRPPVIGEKWGRENGAKEVTVTRLDGDRIYYEYAKGKSGISESGHPYYNSINGFMSWFERVGGPPETPEAPKPVDWARWLPPGPLPDTGPKDFKVGQVWAHTGAAGFALVTRIEREEERYVYCAELAADRRRDVKCFSKDSMYASSAVLVADVGCEPTPPEVLYGQQPKQAPGPEYKHQDGRTIGGNEEAVGATQLSAFQVIQLRKLEAENKRAETAGYLAELVDEFDCLPDVGERRWR